MSKEKNLSDMWEKPEEDSNTGGFKATGRYNIKNTNKKLFHKDSIPSAVHEQDYKAMLKYNSFKDRNQLIIENGVSEAAVVVDGIEETAGYIVIDRLKENKNVADFVYNDKKGLKNVKADDLLDAVNKGYETVDLHEKTSRIIKEDTSFPGNIEDEDPVLEERINEKDN